MANGSNIGRDNRPNRSLASGVWQLEEVYNARLSDQWPQIPLAADVGTLYKVLAEMTGSATVASISGGITTDRPIGTFTANSADDFITVSSHGLANNDKVRFVAGAGVLPAPLAAGSTYWVINSTASTFQVADTQAGAPIDITSAGTTDTNRKVIEVDGFAASAENQIFTDSSLVIASNTNWGSATNDSLMLLVRCDGNLTVNTGITLSLAARKMGLALLVVGNLTVNGTIDLNSKGANLSPTGANITLPPGSLYLFGAPVAPAGLIPFLGAGGGSQGAAGPVGTGGPSQPAPSLGGGAGGTGTAGSSGSTGGGGGGGGGGAGNGGGTSGGPTGQQSSGLAGGAAGAGTTGTAFGSGAAGGGGGGGGGGPSHPSNPTGGVGGAGTARSGGSGSGGSGSAPTTASPAAPGGTGGTGGVSPSAGSVFILCLGNVTINSSGIIRANGVAGTGGNNGSGSPVGYGGGGGGGGGGSTGGGSITILHQGTYTNSGTVQANGGAATGASSGGTPATPGASVGGPGAAGGAGGAGSVRVTSMASV